MPIRRRMACVLCIALLSAMLSGCWQDLPAEDPFLTPQEEETAAEQDEERILPEQFALPYAPDQTLDPITCADGMQQVAASLLCEGLFRLGPDFEPEPWLCESYTYDAATYTYTFTLRGGVTFSDGSPLTASDVRTTLERARASQRYSSRLSGVSRITASGETVIITLSGPNTGFPALLDIPIVKAGTEDSIPIGTGPYLLSVEDSGSWLVSNQSWWRGAARPVDRIALVEASDQETMLYRFNSHEVQLVVVDLTGTASVSVSGNVTYLDADTTILHYLGCNTTRAPLDNPALRSCLWSGINRSYLVSAFFSSHGAASQFPVSPASALYPHALEESYSLADFSSALAELELSSTRTLTLLVNEENRFKVAAAQEIAESFTASGLSVTVRALPWAEYTTALAAGNYDLYYGEVRLSADWDLSPLLATGGALNYGGWSDPQTDQLLAAFSAAADRASAMESLCAYLQEQAPILPICFKSVSVLTQSGVVEGLEPTIAEPFYNFPECSVHLQGSG